MFSNVTGVETEQYEHGEDDNANTPTIHPIGVSLIILLHNDFGSEITGGAAHRLCIMSNET
jgi:hypothetical protein